MASSTINLLNRACSVIVFLLNLNHNVTIFLLVAVLPPRYGVIEFNVAEILHFHLLFLHDMASFGAASFILIKISLALIINLRVTHQALIANQYILLVLD